MRTIHIGLATGDPALAEELSEALEGLEIPSEIRPVTPEWLVSPAGAIDVLFLDSGSASEFAPLLSERLEIVTIGIHREAGPDDSYNGVLTYPLDRGMVNDTLRSLEVLWRTLDVTPIE